MPSRMEKYYENEMISTGRSSKNKKLYDKIQDLDSYSNLEGVETIEYNNEIDISRVKKIIDNRENYKKARELKSLLNDKEEKIVEKEVTIEEEKNYDINDLLVKAKSSIDESENYRKLDENSYRELKNISKNIKKYDDDSTGLMRTMRISKEEIVEDSDEDDVGLLDDLKSNTIVGDASSIKKIIEEEKEKEFDDTSDFEKSLYTTNFGLTKKDFEDLKDLNEKVSKSNNKIMILLLIIIIIIIVAFSIMIFA